MFKILIALITLTAVSNFAHANDAKSDELFMGEYVQQGPIEFEGIDSEASCKDQSSDAVWANSRCTASTENNMTISKVKDLKNTYYVQISILGPDLNSCTFAREMNLVGRKLVFDEVHPEILDNCNLEINKTANGVQLKDKTSCSLYYCGHGVSLGGTNDKFKKVSAGQELFQSEEPESN
jgi:hypothetical protein